MPELPLLDTEITLAKSDEERKRLLDIIETHSLQSWVSFNMLGVRFLGREASGYDRRSFPHKADRNHPRKLGGAKSMIYTLFQCNYSGST